MEGTLQNVWGLATRVLVQGAFLSVGVTHRFIGKGTSPCKSNRGNGENWFDFLWKEQRRSCRQRHMSLIYNQLWYQLCFTIGRPRLYTRLQSSVQQNIVQGNKPINVATLLFLQRYMFQTPSGHLTLRILLEFYIYCFSPCIRTHDKVYVRPFPR